jgi:nucleotide-binding universal stress UspA family protein
MTTLLSTSDNDDVVMGLKTGQGVPPSLARAVLEAESRHRPLRVLSAWVPQTWLTDPVAAGSVPLLAPDSSAAQVEDQLGSTLKQALLAGRRQRPVRATVLVQPGSAGRVLADASRRAALVVVGGRRSTRLRDAVWGSTDAHLLRHAACPVMVVPADATTEPFRRVVLWLDPTCPPWSPALSWAESAADRYHCPLVLLRPEGGTKDALQVQTGPADLVVVSALPRRGWRQRLLGSWAEGCARQAQGVLVAVPGPRRA